MPIKVKDTDGGIGNIIIGSGVISEEEYIDFHRKHLTQDKSKFMKYRYSLPDWREVSDVNVSIKAFRLIADMCQDAVAINPDVVIAAVANRDLTYGLARMGQALRDGSSWENAVLSNMEDAKNWIRARVKERFGIEDLTFECSQSDQVDTDPKR